jgi:hypothetical protein
MYWITLPSAVALFLLFAPRTFAQEAGAKLAGFESRELLTADEWQSLDAATDRGLDWLARVQEADGSFTTYDTGQPGVTALCLLAFLARGHVPGEGEYGSLLNRSLQYVFDCLLDDGMIAKHPPTGSVAMYRPAHTAAYNHAISGLLLCEVYGMSPRDLSPRMTQAIRAAIEQSLQLQHDPAKKNAADIGGWRYAARSPSASSTRDVDSDLSVTSWQLLFLRSAKNAGFNVSNDVIEEALQYVRRLYHPPSHTFNYAAGYRTPDWTTRAMTGAGILSLSAGGQHNAEIAEQAAVWIFEHDFQDYNHSLGDNDSYHYGVFYCTLGLFQMGEPYYSRFYPKTMRTLLANQGRQGNWMVDSEHSHATFGDRYTTALALIALSTPYQVLPIMQR